MRPAIIVKTANEEKARIDWVDWEKKEVGVFYLAESGRPFDVLPLTKEIEGEIYKFYYEKLSPKKQREIQKLLDKAISQKNTPEKISNNLTTLGAHAAKGYRPYILKVMKENNGLVSIGQIYAYLEKHFPFNSDDRAKETDRNLKSKDVVWKHRCRTEMQNLKKKRYLEFKNGWWKLTALGYKVA